MSRVKMNTNHGSIVIQLNSDKAPKTVENFLSYVNDGFYNGTLFHRVIDNFMIQGGGLKSGMQEKPTHSPIPNEANNGLSNSVGTVAMARTSEPHSATAQFFINVAENNFLNHTAPSAQGWGYCVFGEVVEGLDVVNKIKKLPTGRHGYHKDVPTNEVVIESAEVVS